MDLVILWVVFTLGVGVWAHRIGRSAFGWALISFLLSPVVGAVLLLIAGRAKGSEGAAPTPETHVRCPDCRELVRRDARKCKHCGTALIPQ